MIKTKKLSVIFLKNYIILFVLLIIFVGLVYTFNNNYINANNEIYIDGSVLEKTYLNDGLEVTIKVLNLEEQDQIIVMSRDNIIVDEINSNFQVGHQLTDDEYLLNFVEVSDYTNLIFYSMYHDDIYFIVRLSTYVFIEDILVPLSILFSVLAIIFIVYFAKLSAKKIIYPITLLEEGIDEIKSGNLDFRIDFDADNELDNLKESINHLASELNHEIKARKTLEINRQELIRNVSHDIKTPLTNIMGYSETLIEDPDMNPEQKKHALNTINSYSNQANHLVDELFELSSLELENETFDIVETDITELLRKRIIAYIGEFELKSISYDIQLPEDSILINADPIKLNRVIDNLIQNSIKYNTDNFSMVFSLAKILLTKSNKEEVIIRISDNGIGIPKEFHTSIFNPTVRVEKSRNHKHQGYGLGLAIAKNIISRHSGTIYLDDTQSNGACFVIHLPIYND